MNTSDSPVDLSGWRLTHGIGFTFGEAVLGAGEHVVLVENLEAFLERYGWIDVQIAGIYTGKLSNAGEGITLVDDLGVDVASFDYDDDWYPETDGGGRSLVAASLPGENDPGQAASWRPSRDVHGSPGRAD